jgi:hypothetical protein
VPYDICILSYNVKVALHSMGSFSRVLRDTMCPCVQASMRPCVHASMRPRVHASMQSPLLPHHSSLVTHCRGPRAHLIAIYSLSLSSAHFTHYVTLLPAGLEVSFHRCMHVCRSAISMYICIVCSNLSRSSACLLSVCLPACPSVRVAYGSLFLTHSYNIS